jgi:hypothetical protein
MAKQEREPLNPRTGEGRPNGRPGGRRPRISLSGFYLLVFLLLGFLALQTLFLRGGAPEVPYSVFLEQVERGDVERVVVVDEVKVTGLYAGSRPSRPRGRSGGSRPSARGGGSRA